MLLSLKTAVAAGELDDEIALPAAWLGHTSRSRVVGCVEPGRLGSGSWLRSWALRSTDSC